MTKKVETIHSIKFKIGDLVRLKSGGPKMTVTSEPKPELAPNDVHCKWFAGEKSMSDWFPSLSLIAVDTESDEY